MKVKGFKEFYKEKELIEAFLNSEIICIFETDDAIARNILEFLIEGGRTYTINKRFSFRADPAHVPGQKAHNHILFKGNEIGVINRDGTSSHGTDIGKLPKHILDAIKAKGFLDETYKTSRSIIQSLIESILLEVEYQSDLAFAVQRSEEIMNSQARTI